MDLLDRYLAAIRRHLPPAQADDILAELRDVLLTREEERSETLGRPITDRERADLIQEYGPPLIVAARYWPRQQLIGPQAFPYYVATLKIVVAIVWAIPVVSGLVNIVFGHGDAAQIIVRTAAVMWSGLITTVGALTLIFYGMERIGVGTRLMSRWRPESLPHIQLRPRARWERLTELVASGVFLLWWTGVLPLHQLVPPAGRQLEFHLAPVFHQLYWPIFAVVGAAMVAGLAALTEPGRPRLLAILDTVVAVAHLVVIGQLLGAGHWLEVNSVRMDPGQLQQVGQAVNLGFRTALYVVGLVWLFKAIGRGWRLTKALSGTGAGRPAVMA